MKGSAIRVADNWYDSHVDNVTIIDCGSAAHSPLVIGGASSDSNRVTFVDLRIERCTTPSVVIGKSYEIDFLGCKFHEGVAGQTNPLVQFDANATDIHIIGGQLKVSASTPGINLRGSRHKIQALGVYGDLNTASKGIYGDAVGSEIDVTAINVGTPIDLRSGRRNNVTGAFTVCGAVWVGAYSSVHDAVFTQSNDTYSLATATVVLEGEFGSAESNVFDGWSSSVDQAILAKGRGCSAINNRAKVAGGVSTPTRLVYLAGANGVSTYQTARDNRAVGIAAAEFIKEQSTDASRVLTNNVTLAA